MRKIYITLFLTLLVTLQSYAQLIGPANGGNFNGASFAADNWAVATNIVGTGSPDTWVENNGMAPFSAPKCAYVTTNAGGAPPPTGYTANKWDTLIVYRTLNVTFPANQSCISLSFRWQCQGTNASIDEDNMKVFLIPSTIPVNSNALQPTYQIGANWYNQQIGWALATFNLDPKLAGSATQYVLAFAFFANGDASVLGPAAGVDDVLLTTAAPTAVPTCAIYIDPASGSSGLSPCSITLLWNHVQGCNGATAYDVYYGTVSPGTILAGTTSANNWTLSGLAASTTYYWHIRPKNSFGTNNSCNLFVFNFTTGTNPPLTGVPPLLEDFESCNNWSTYNGAAPNAWFRGTATSAGGTQSMYISNNGGASNTYTVTSSSIVHIMNTGYTIDLTGVTAGSCATLSFDYHNAGEVGFDYMNVYKVPIGFVPTPGAVPAGGGVVQIAGPLVGQAAYANFSASLAPYIGTSFRLVFTFICDNSIGSQPPAAVDNISVTATGGPPNDVPCGATFIPPLSTAGIFIPGSNICAGNADEPAAPACWTNSGGVTQINTVWFRFTAPASGCVKIRTERGSLYDTQIAVYGPILGTVGCGSGASLLLGGSALRGCNDNRPACGANTYLNSEISLCALSAGFTYYIAVDGKNGNVGTFSLFIMDGGAGNSIPYPATPAQDCASPILVCQANNFIPNPGFQAFGAVCDFPSGINCLASGERGSCWFLINVATAGEVQFDIVPNDWTGFSSTDYDFAIWRLQANNVCDGNNTNGVCCTEIAAGAAPDECDYSALGVTGCYGAADDIAPPAYAPFYNTAYQNAPTALAGYQYVINVSNFSNSTAGFSLNLANGGAAGWGGLNNATYSGTAPVGGNVIWTGSVSSDWFTAANWGGCAVPSCASEVDAIITSAYVNAPSINMAASCRNITINSGGTLTITGSGSLDVCKDYLNNGTINCQTGSIVRFNGPNTGTYNPAGTQNIDGVLTGSNAFHHLEILKGNQAWHVNANQDFDVKGNLYIGQNQGLTANNVTTYFDAAPAGNGKYTKVGGHLMVYATGATASTFNPGTTLEFNGAANQNYFNRGTINSFYANQSAPSTITLQNHGAASPFLSLSSSGILTLTNGKIVSPGTANGYVNIANTAANAVTAGNINSYIEMPNAPFTYALRRSMTSGVTGIYNFPVGTTLKGYELISFNLTSPLLNAGIINYWQVGFNNTSPVANTVLGNECPNVKYNDPTVPITALNHGYWQLQANPATLYSASTRMDVTTYNRSYANGTGAGWTVMYNKAGSNASANWLLDPVTATPCSPSPITATLRKNLQPSNLFTSAIPVWLGTAQSQTPLPVELLAFTATAKSKTIDLDWTTASELNCDGFEIERGTRIDAFERIGWTKGNGTTHDISTYIYSDKNVKPNVLYYYRLKQLDFNGSYNYSHIVAATLNKDGFVFNAFPNPYSDKTLISYTLDKTSVIKVEVVNTLGQVITVLADGLQDAGTYELNFSAQALGYSGGVYTARILVDGKTYSKRLFELQ